MRVHGSTRKLRRLLRTGRFRPQSYTISLQGGRWRLSVAGTATALHPNRTTSRRRGTPRIAMSVTDAAMAELARQIGYKAEWGACEVVTVDRWFPSSKTCSGCGHHHADLPRGAATFDCPACGRSIDRDLNAATNLAREDHRTRSQHPPPQVAAW